MLTPIWSEPLNKALFWWSIEERFVGVLLYNEETRQVGWAYWMKISAGEGRDWNTWRKSLRMWGVVSIWKWRGGLRTGGAQLTDDRMTETDPSNFYCKPKYCQNKIVWSHGKKTYQNFLLHWWVSLCPKFFLIHPTLINMQFTYLQR